MPTIHLKVVTGEEFTITNKVYGGSGPLEDLKDAQVQARLLVKELVAVPTDQGKTVNVAQIVYHWIEK